MQRDDATSGGAAIACGEALARTGPNMKWYAEGDSGESEETLKEFAVSVLVRVDEGCFGRCNPCQFSCPDPRLLIQVLLHLG